MDGQTIVALAVVASAAAVVVRKAFGTFQGGSGCGTGCGSCPGGAKKADPAVNGFVPIDDLRHASAESRQE